MNEHYPNAAKRHLEDSKRLLDASSWHGSAYLAGYVLECSLKACITQPVAPEDVKVRDIGHDLQKLRNVLDGMAASRQTGRKRNVSFGLLGTLASRLTAQEPAWEPSMRYGSTDPRWKITANGWWDLANRCFLGMAKNHVTEGA